MKNFVQTGKILTAPAPSGGVLSGEAILIGGIFGVAAFAAAEAAEVEISTEGVFSLPKTTSQSWAFGDPLYWDASTKKLTKTAGNNLVVGAAALAAGSADAFGNVKLGAPGSAFGGLTAPAAAITDAFAAATNPPTKTEFDALVTKFNASLAVLRGMNAIAD